MLRFFIIGIVVCASAGAASAATCATMVADTESYLKAHPDSSGTLAQTKDAQLMHQPTRDAVSKAKMQSREHLADLLARAKSLQASNDEAGCRATLADVERMLTP